MSLSTVRDEKGNPIAMMGASRDITERKKLEEDLKKAAELNKRIIENSNDCIKTLDLEGRLLSMSIGGQGLLEIDDINPLL